MVGSFFRRAARSRPAWLFGRALPALELLVMDNRTLELLVMDSRTLELLVNGQSDP